jgi:ankyrin repeat protein
LGEPSGSKASLLKQGECEVAVRNRVLEENLREFARQGDRAGMASCMEQGALLDAVNDEGWTPLMRAASAGQVEAARMLLAAGASPDVADKRVYGYTASMSAAVAGRLEVLGVLRDAGANFELRNHAGASALILAAEHGHEACVELIAESGASLDARDKEGNTALMMAVYKSHEACVARLIGAGANVDQADGEKKAPLYWAVARGNALCVELLLAAGAKIDSVDRNGRSALDAARFLEDEDIVGLIESEAERRLLALSVASVEQAPRAAKRM